jgi:hypothetical protein
MCKGSPRYKEITSATSYDDAAWMDKMETEHRQSRSQKMDDGGTLSWP